MQHKIKPFWISSLLLNSPEYDEVHAVFVCVVIFFHALFRHSVEILDGFDLLINLLIRVKVRIHVVAKHQTAQVLLRYLKHSDKNKHFKSLVVPTFF